MNDNRSIRTDSGLCPTVEYDQKTGATIVTDGDGGTVKLTWSKMEAIHAMLGAILKGTSPVVSTGVLDPPKNFQTC